MGPQASRADIVQTSPRVQDFRIYPGRTIVKGDHQILTLALELELKLPLSCCPRRRGARCSGMPRPLPPRHPLTRTHQRTPPAAQLAWHPERGEAPRGGPKTAAQAAFDRNELEPLWGPSICPTPSRVRSSRCSSRSTVVHHLPYAFRHQDSGVLLNQRLQAFRTQRIPAVKAGFR